MTNHKWLILLMNAYKSNYREPKQPEVLPDLLRVWL